MLRKADLKWLENHEKEGYSHHEIVRLMRKNDFSEREIREGINYLNGRDFNFNDSKHSYSKVEEFDDKYYENQHDAEEYANNKSSNNHSNSKSTINHSNNCTTSSSSNYSKPEKPYVKPYDYYYGSLDDNERKNDNVKQIIGLFLVFFIGPLSLIYNIYLLRKVENKALTIIAIVLGLIPLLMFGIPLILILLFA